MRKALDQRSFTAPIAEALFAMVANRALAPSSKLAIEQWAAEEVFLGNNEPVQVQHLYRAMDFLLEHEQTIQLSTRWAGMAKLIIGEVSERRGWFCYRRRVEL